jgi:HEAT repeat protein
MRSSLRFVPFFFCLLLILDGATFADEQNPPPEDWQLKGILAALKDDYPQVKVRALEELAKALPSATERQKELVKEEGVEQLIELLKHKEHPLRAATARALAQLKELPWAALDRLAGLLEDAERDVRDAAAEALAGQKELPQATLDRLAVLLKGAERDVQRAAVWALGGRKELPPAALDPLIHLLRDNDWGVREGAVNVLAGQKKLPLAALDSLAILLKEEDSRVREAALKALAGRKELPPATLGSFVGLLKDEQTDIRQATAEALAIQKELPPTTIGSLIYLHTVKQAGVREAAVWALAGRKELPQAALASLTGLLKDPDREVREAAVWALAGRKELPPPALESFIGLLKDEARGVREAAVWELGGRKKLPAAALESVRGLLSEKAAGVRATGAKALAGQKEWPPAALGTLIDLLEDAEREVWEAAARALGGRKELPPDALDRLIHLLRDKQARVREAAVWALAGRKELPPDALNRLIDVIMDGDEHVRSGVVWKLAGREELPAAAHGRLTDLLEDPNGYVREGAVNVLAGQKKLPLAALDSLARLLKDEAPGVQKAAVKALTMQKDLPPATLGVLIDLLRAEQASVREAAVWALAGRKKLPPDALDSPTDFRRNAELADQEAAAWALAGRKELPPSALKSFIGLLKDESWGVRKAAVWALAGRTDLPAADLASLAVLLKDANRGVRKAALWALAGQKELPPAVLDHVTGPLRDAGWADREFPVWGGSWGGTKQLPPSALNRLTLLLRGADRGDQEAAEWALSNRKERASTFFIDPPYDNSDSKLEEVLMKVRSPSIVTFLHIPYANKALLYEARWLAHYNGRGESENETLCQYLGRPKTLPNSPTGRRDTLALLKTLGAAFDQSDQNQAPWLRQDAALWAGHVFSDQGIGWGKNDLTLVKSWIERLEREKTDPRLAAYLPELRRIRDRLEDSYLELRSVAVALLIGLVAVGMLKWIPAEWSRAKEWVPMLTLLGGAIWKGVEPSFGKWSLSPGWMIGTLAVVMVLILTWGLHSTPFLRDLAKVAPFNFFVLALAHRLPSTRRRLYAEARDDAAKKAEQTKAVPHAASEDPLYHPLPAWNLSAGDDKKAPVDQPIEEIVKLLTNPVGQRGHVLIKGPAGLGKTTLLKKVVRRLLEEFEKTPTRRPLPVYLAAEGDGIEERLRKGLGTKALIAPELLPTYLERGWFVLVADNIDVTGLSNAEIAALHSSHHYRSPLLLCGREPEPIRKAITEGTPNALVVEPAVLDDRTLDGFVDHYIRHLNGQPLPEEMKKACRGPNGYVPLLVRLAVTLPAESVAKTKADVFREYLYRQCKCEKQEETGLLKDVAQLALKTYWETGKPQFDYDGNSTLQKRLKEAGILVPYGAGGVCFFHDSVRTYFTAEGLLTADLNDYRDLPRPKELPNTPWSRSRALFWMAARPEFASLQSDGASELLDMFLTLFVSQDADEENRPRLVSEIRCLLRDEVKEIEERYRPFKKKVTHYLGSPPATLPLIPDAVPNKNQLPQGDTRELIEAAVEACFREDERTGTVTLLKKLYAKLAERVFDRTLSSDKEADKTIAKEEAQSSEATAPAEEVMSATSRNA